MNKVGIYYAYWTHNWAADFVPFVAKAKKLGFDVLEVNSGTVADMSPAERRRLQDAGARHGIELTACIGLPAKYDPASPNRRLRAICRTPSPSSCFSRRMSRVLRIDTGFLAILSSSPS
jgi:D-psicose/D-tagatose/L-ribulose 3-epimerase